MSGLQWVVSSALSQEAVILRLTRDSVNQPRRCHCCFTGSPG